MNKKSNAKKRRLLLVIMLFSTATFLSTATYAWFTANKVVTVNPIQVNVEAQGGIQVSVDGTNWKSVVSIADLTSADVTYAAAVNQIPATLEPVSTGGVVDATGKLEMYYGSVTTNGLGDYILTTTKTTETHNNANGEFVAFDLFFRSDSAAQLYLTTNSSVVTPDPTDTGIKNTARVAFVILGNTAIGSTLPTIQGLNSGAVSPVYTWEPNYNSHTAPAIANAFDTYGLTVTDGGSAVPYSGVKAVITAPDDVELGEATATNFPTFFNSMNTTYKTENGFSTYVTIFSVSAGITKIRMYMWIEGQDVDTENSASGGNATFNLQISNEMP